MEKWKDIPGYDGIYQVSNHGRVRSLPRKVWNYMKPGRVLRQQNNGHGYNYLSLSCGEKKSKHVYVHVLVAQAFISNPKGYSQVNHKDFDKSNNCASNLEWVSPEQNKAHYRQSAYCKAVEEGRQRVIRGKWVKRVLAYKENVIAHYVDGKSINEIAAVNKIGRDFTSDILRLYGYIR